MEKDSQHQQASEDEDDWMDELEKEIESDLTSKKPLSATALSRPSDLLPPSKLQTEMPLEILVLIFEFCPFGLQICESWRKAAVFAKRRIVTRKLDSIFASYSSCSIIRNNIAVSIESELYKIHPNWSSSKDYRDYMAKARQLSFNLRDNTALCTQVLSNDIPPHILVTLNADGLAKSQLTDKRREWAKKRKLEVTREDGVAGNACTITDMFTCPSCHGKETSYRQWRRKAIVDRVRIIIMCRTCPYRWEL